MNRILFTCLNVFVVCVSIGFVESVTDSTAITLDFVHKARDKLKLSENPNVILVVGTTGVGKSALVHCVATKCDKLSSIDTGEVEYTVRDELDTEVGNITLSSVSRTLTPDINVDEAQNVWYDCPGFGDTRNETVEIATTYLIKCVIENASNAKIVLVVDYDSVTSGHNRDGFDKLLSRTVQLLKSTEKFENSVSLVISKAPSFKIRKRQYFEISDDQIIESCVRFVRAHRSVLQERESNVQKIGLIDALLKQSSNGNFSKISIFWRPNDEGYFNTIDKMMTGRIRIRDSIIQHTSYTKIHKNDFGFPLTAEAQIKIANMSTETTDGILNMLQNITNHLKGKLLERIDMAHDFHTKLGLISIGKQIIHRTFDSINAKRLNQQLKRLIQTFNVSSIDVNQFNQIEKHENNLNLLQSLVQTKSHTQEMNLNLYIKEIDDFFNEIEMKIKTAATDKDQQISEHISTILTRIESKLPIEVKDKIESAEDFDEKLRLIERARHCIGLSGRAESITQLANKIKTLVQMLDLKSIEMNDFERIDHLTFELVALKTVVKSNAIAPFISKISLILRNTEIILSGLENKIQSNVMSETRWKMANISNILSNIDIDLLNEIQRKLELTYGLQSKLEFLELAKVYATKSLGEIALNQKIQQIIGLVEVFGVTNYYQSDIKLIEMYENQLNDLRTISASEIKLPIRDWIATSSNANEFVIAEYNWYAFLKHVYETLAVQKDVTAHSVASISDWGQTNKSQGPIVDKSNFSAFVKKFSNLIEFKSTPNKLKELNEIIKTTLKSPTTFECVNQHLTATGIIIRSSDISVELKKCYQPHKVERISIYAVDKFYVDSNLNLSENEDIELHIFTNEFNVLQTATFNLNGKDGAYQSISESSGMPGKPGEPGITGGNSGNFFALTNKIINGKLLTVQQIAGNGGNGQKGNGSPSVHVNFDNRTETDTNFLISSIFDIDGYVRDLVLKRTQGAHEKETIWKDGTTWSYFAVVAAKFNDHFEFDFRPTQCCGGAGIGGRGDSSKNDFSVELLGIKRELPNRAQNL